ncbi:impact family protein [Nannizzia gypsea CBS 118893]|uniref:Impact family protein n=1 Tax=Arthroderma gypseum (strain ATCC MYA-4604 / CBS 118893) TaxID=535722 RepID=E4UV52_ARTGP|nr:impact family protein [Nannizzia gypsea CBS 118893]EFR01169.1 impact family protein [Nannizzia gypsea CBS 118893]
MDSEERIVENEDLAEEIDSVNAIYDPSTIAFTTSSPHPELAIKHTIILTIPNHETVSFLIGFDSEYPTTPPRVLGPASSGSRGEGKKYADILADSVAKVWAEGSVCLYDLIMDAEEQFREIKSTQNEENGSTSENDGPSTSTRDEKDTHSFGLTAPPPWVISDPITEKKSVFVARAATVESKEQAKKFLNHLLATEKKVASATHNITAWRIRQAQQPSSGPQPLPGRETVVQDFDDDGETAAGGRLLHLMQLMDVWDVVVVVTRWYGGVKLGPDRFRIINAAARDALVKGGFETSQPTEKGKKKGKK